MFRRIREAARILRAREGDAPDHYRAYYRVRAEGHGAIAAGFMKLVARGTQLGIPHRPDMIEDEAEALFNAIRAAHFARLVLEPWSDPA